MLDLDYNHLWINDELNNFEQIIPRCYTLINAWNISDLFLCINHDFMYQKLISTENKLLAEWKTLNQKNYLCYIYLTLDSTSDDCLVQSRIDDIPRLLSAIKYADLDFFRLHPELLDASIYIFFQSKNLELDRIEQWGTFYDY